MRKQEAACPRATTWKRCLRVSLSSLNPFYGLRVHRGFFLELLCLSLPSLLFLCWVSEMPSSWVGKATVAAEILGMSAPRTLPVLVHQRVSQVQLDNDLLPTLMNGLPDSAAPGGQGGWSGWNRRSPSAPWSWSIPWPNKKGVRLFQRRLCHVLFHSNSRTSLSTHLWLVTEAFIASGPDLQGSIPFPNLALEQGGIFLGPKSLGWLANLIRLI